MAGSEFEISVNIEIPTINYLKIIVGRLYRGAILTSKFNVVTGFQVSHDIF